MKKRNIFLIAFFLLFSGLIFSLLFARYQSDKESENKVRLKEVFEKEITAALDLKYVSYNPLYAHSSYVRIIKDTIMGFNNGFNDYNAGFFFQSLKPLKTATLVQVTFQEHDPYPSDNYIGYYNNGCMYFGAYGGSRMERVCIDGTTRDYFSKYENTMFYANKVLLYKDKAAITSMNGIYIFDIKKEKLLWSERYGNELFDGFSVLIDNKFYYVSIRGTFVCMNLDTLKKEWETPLKIKMDYPYSEIYQELQSIYHSDNIIAIYGLDKLLLINSKTGKIIWNFPWNIKPSVDQPTVKIIDKLIYFSNKGELYCIDYTSNNLIWKFKDAIFKGIYKNFVIAMSKNSDFYLIINKDTGKLKTKIITPKNGYPIVLVDSYVIIDNRTIYK
ncbi:hypothetical protein A5893_11655 [Pedobacter psychrophilus]|uniref:Pyrrolo-quinoline quinone repeat domain-containing protein n=1 Tax=Pedobacter psychrophilus TaxID=1826909 RepID=A0A179DE56_9SPHI|nr:PQQ-binding-like beta-propeller repeat protein [Pedobacter psychrophilus]OAQ39311.1 hypothetical protein A5893_11655 [Pedobacter psychrophilus]